jgi:hypothetical protein
MHNNNPRKGAYPVFTVLVFNGQASEGGRARRPLAAWRAWRGIAVFFELA